MSKSNQIDKPGDRSEAPTYKSGNPSAGDQINMSCFYHALDTQMHRHYRRDEWDQADGIALITAKDVKAPLLFRSRALTILATRVGHPASVTHAKLAVKLLELATEERPEGKTLIIPERVWRRARNVLAQAEKDVEDKIPIEDPRVAAAFARIEEEEDDIEGTTDGQDGLTSLATEDDAANAQESPDKEDHPIEQLTAELAAMQVHAETQVRAGTGTQSSS